MSTSKGFRTALASDISGTITGDKSTQKRKISKRSDFEALRNSDPNIVSNFQVVKRRHRVGNPDSPIWPQDLYVGR